MHAHAEAAQILSKSIYNSPTSTLQHCLTFTEIQDMKSNPIRRKMTIKQKKKAKAKAMYCRNAPLLENRFLGKNLSYIYCLQLLTLTAIMYVRSQCGRKVQKCLCHINLIWKHIQLCECWKRSVSNRSGTRYVVVVEGRT